MVGVLIGDAPWTRLLASRPFVYVGTRAYGIYLVHLICLSVVVSAVQRVYPGAAFDALNRPTGSHRLDTSLLIFAVGAIVSVAVADVLHRTVERTFIGFGRRWSRSIAPRAAIVPPRLIEGEALQTETT